MPGLWIEVGVSTAEVDCSMSESDIRKASRVVGSNGNIARDVGHVVVDTRIPAQRERWMVSPNPGNQMSMLAGREDGVGAPAGRLRAPRGVPPSVGIRG